MGGRPASAARVQRQILRGMVRVELRDAHLSIKELVQTGMIRHTDTKKTVLLYLPGQESRLLEVLGTEEAVIAAFLAAFNAVELTR